MMGIISEKFNAKINDLKMNFNVNKNIIHQGVKGGLNEVELSQLMKQVMPGKYKISKGIIENYLGEQSNETDFFIYDDEVLPTYIKEELAFVPIEAVKYVFEVKSTLNVKELNTTIQKFKKFMYLSGRCPRVLFAFSSDVKGSELKRYKKCDENFFTNPAISVLCISNKAYYFKTVEEKYLKDHLICEKLLNQINENGNLTISLNGQKFIIEANSIQSNSTNNKLTINGLDYSQIKFSVHKWIGIEHADNTVELSLLSGISNTLCKENFGNYLLFDRNHEPKVFSICYEDMWGNLSCQDFDEDGLSYDPDNVFFNFQSRENSSQLIFSKKY